MNIFQKNIQNIGILLWLIFFLFHFSAGMQAISWVYILIELAVLILVPLGLKSLKIWKENQNKWLISSILFTFAYFLPQGFLAGFCVLFWLIFSISLIISPLTNLFLQKKASLQDICELLSFVFLSVGAAWAFADRIAFQPLDFDPVIVLLTVAHFHYAGFLLALITSLALRENQTLFSRIVGWFIIAGIPFVAIGITTSKLNFPFYIEIGAATIMAFGGIGIGILHLKKIKGLTEIVWLFGAIGLISGMTLAILYGWRFVFPQSWLVIPRMYAWHGTLNSISLSLLLIGYRHKKHERS